MKRKTCSILFVLVLVISLGLTMTVPASAQAPTATFSPTSGPVGTKVTVSGTGWAASEAISSVTVGLGTSNGVPATNSLTVDASGNLSGTITIPNVAAGAQDIYITGATSGPQTFTGAFTVTTPTATFSLTSGPAIIAIAILSILLILLIVLFMSMARRRAQRVTQRAAQPSPIPPAEQRVTPPAAQPSPIPPAEQRVTPPATQPSSAPPAGLTCPRCQAKLPANTKFCIQCGMRLPTPLVCPSCGAQVPEGAKFCSQCGTTIQGRYG